MTAHFTAPESTTVPSILRRSPSESEARAGAGAGCGSIRAHQAPRRHHKVARGSQAIRWARRTAKPHKTVTGAIAANTNPGRSQTQCVTAIPTAKSHAAWNSGAALRPAEGCPEVWDSDCIGPDNLKELLGPAYQARRKWTTDSKWNVWGNRSTRVRDWIE